MLPQGKPMLIATLSHIVNFFQIDAKTGKLSPTLKFQADFSEENPSLNQVALNFDSNLLATGGDDKTVRVFSISADFKSSEKKHEVKVAEDAIQSVDISRDNRFLAAGSKDGTAYVMDLANQCAVL